MKMLHRRGTRFLPWAGNFDELRRICPRMPDEYLLRRIAKESVAVWNSIRARATDEEVAMRISAWLKDESSEVTTSDKSGTRSGTEPQRLDDAAE
jgi:hypothetical protein